MIARTAASATQKSTNETRIAPPSEASCTNGRKAIWVCPKCQGNKRIVISSAIAIAMGARGAKRSINAGSCRYAKAKTRKSKAPVMTNTPKINPEMTNPNPPKVETVGKTQ